MSFILSITVTMGKSAKMAASKSTCSGGSGGSSTASASCAGPSTPGKSNYCITQISLDVFTIRIIIINIIKILSI
jgi:hypothetical protein